MLSFQYFSRGECLPDVTLEGQPSNSRSLSARSDPVIKRSSFSCHSLLPYSLTARVGSLSSVALFGLHLQYGIIFVGYSHLHGLFFITNNYAYKDRISEDKLITGKKNTQKIERNHLTLRTRIKRLARKTICFSKSKDIHIAVIGTFINLFFYDRPFDTSTIL